MDEDSKLTIRVVDRRRLFLDDDGNVVEKEPEEEIVEIGAEEFRNRENRVSRPTATDGRNEPPEGGVRRSVWDRLRRSLRPRRRPSRP